MVVVSVVLYAGLQAARLDLGRRWIAGRGDRTGRRRRGASLAGCPAAPGCAAGGSADDVSPADFTLVLADGPLPDVAAPAGRWRDFRVPTDTRRRARRPARGAPPGGGRGAGGGRLPRGSRPHRDGAGRARRPRRAVARRRGELGARDYHRRAVETPWQRWWLRRRPLTADRRPRLLITGHPGAGEHAGARAVRITAQLHRG